MRCLAAAAAAVLAMLGAAPATAVTLNAGGLLCESGGRGFTSAQCPRPVRIGDFPEDTGANAGPIIDLAFSGAGTAQVLGFIANVGGADDSQYEDVATFRGTGRYVFRLELIDPDAGFTADWSMGGAFSQPISGATVLTTTLDLSAGDARFNLDASSAGNAARLESRYALTVQAIPVPAGALLLLSGLAGAAALRGRRQDG